MPGFRIDRSRSAGAEVTERIPATVNTQYKRYDACKLVAGDLIQVGVTDKMSHVYEALETLPSVLRPSTFDLSDPVIKQETLAIPVQGRDVWLQSDLTGTYLPPIDKVLCNSNASTASVLVPYSGTTANGDFTGGTIYSQDYNQHRRITASTYSGGVHTMTLDAPFLSGPTTAVALSTTNTVTVVPVAKGSTAVKFKDSQRLDVSVAGKSGGNNKIEEVNLATYKIWHSCPYLS